MAGDVTFKKGTFSIATRAGGANGKQEVSGWVSSSGLAIHKSGKSYQISQARSGLGIVTAESFAEAKQKAARINKVANWTKPLKPSYELAQKVRAADKGEKIPRKSPKPKKDEYDLKAYARDKGGNLVEHEQATGYEGQKRERRYIRR